MLDLWYSGYVTKIINETHNTRRFWIEVPGTDHFDFKPGQFVTLDLPIHEKKNKRWRSYSIASHPNGSNIIELVIVLLEGGPGSTYLFTEVKEGSELLMRGPQGVFVLPETLDRDLYLICTGTGIAPFRSMAHYIKIHDIPHKDIYLIYGSRYIKDLLYPQEMRDLQNELPGFHYIPTLSREDDPSWWGRKGYVHTIYEEMLSTEKPSANFFLCGWKAMIDEAKQRIQALGYDRKSIHQELYG
jgi:ferredoxin-NADP reductase